MPYEAFLPKMSNLNLTNRLHLTTTLQEIQGWEEHGKQCSRQNPESRKF